MTHWVADSSGPAEFPEESSEKRVSRGLEPRRFAGRARVNRHGLDGHTPVTERNARHMATMLWNR